MPNIPNTQQPVRIITYPMVRMDVIPQPGGVLLVATTPQGDALQFPMNDKAASIIGKALTAPRVHVPDHTPSNGHEV